MTKRVILAVFLSFVRICVALGQTSQAVYFGLEDDFLHYNGHGSDRYYTGGLSLGWMRMQQNKGFVIWQGSLNQKVFTPTDISKTVVQYEDYPYAGLLYGHISHDLFHSEFKYGWGWTMAGGTTGRNSFAAPFQQEIHRWIGYKRPQGWAHIVEAGILAQGNVRGWYRLADDSWASVYGFSMVEAGTLFSSVTLGTTIQFGHRAKSSLDHLFPVLSRKGRKTLKLYAFCIPSIKWVLHNAILEEGLVTNPLTSNIRNDIALTPLLLQSSIGLFIHIASWSVRVVQHSNTREFRGARPHTFGEVTVFYHF